MTFPADKLYFSNVIWTFRIGLIFLQVQNYDLDHIPSTLIKLKKLKYCPLTFIVFCAKYSRFIFIKNSNEADGCSCTGLMRKNGLTLHFKFEETAILNLNFSQIKEIKFMQKKMLNKFHFLKIIVNQALLTFNIRAPHLIFRF